MIGRAFELQEAIKLYALSKDIDMNTACWDRFKEIHNFLKKFKEVSVYMCADTYPTLSMAVPNYNKLLTHIEFRRTRTNSNTTLFAFAFELVRYVREHYERTLFFFIFINESN